MNTSDNPWVRSMCVLACIAVLFAMFVVMLGAYTRLTDAGLGCPDWPGCYGKMVLPSAKQARAGAQALYPDVPIEAGKAWTEMAHRYAAGTLGLLIASFAVLGLVGPRRLRVSPWLSASLLTVLFFQAALGMWTVTLKLLPVVVMGHLLGGMTLASLLMWLKLKWHQVKTYDVGRLKPWIVLAIVIVFVQIALGGWVSSNYAGLACLGFPECNQHWWPTLDLKSAFDVLSPVGANYQGGLLDSTARVTIQWVHRLWAMVTFVYVSVISLTVFAKFPKQSLGRLALWIFLLVVGQCVLGILNVVMMLPLSVAVLHNGVALLLLLSLLVLGYMSSGKAS